MCSTSPSDMLRVIQLREDHPQEIHACLGIHPLDDSDWAELGGVSQNSFETCWPFPVLVLQVATCKLGMWRVPRTAKLARIGKTDTRAALLGDMIMSEHRQRGLAALGERLDREHEPPARSGRLSCCHASHCSRG